MEIHIRQAQIEDAKGILGERGDCFGDERLPEIHLSRSIIRTYGLRSQQRWRLPSHFYMATRLAWNYT